MEFLERLKDPARPRIDERIAIVAAHPDDETIGAGSQLARLENVAIIHVTDGSPSNPKDAYAAGFRDTRAYASERRREFESVLKLTGIPLSNSHQLGFRDQNASYCLVDITRALTSLLKEFEPEIVVTHPYEGGHPDHDACAFCVHAVAAFAGKPVQVIEMTSYHLRDGVFETGEFLPSGGVETVSLPLQSRETELKRKLFGCYQTQKNVLSAFGLTTERFRKAPRYDFRQPPHSGQLHYERSDFQMTGDRFRLLAAKALADLRLAI